MATPPSNNPYATPRARLADNAGHSQLENFRPEGVIVSSGTGTTWWRDGVQIFRANPWLWIGVIVVFFLLNIVVQIIPIIGGIIALLFGPVMLAGLMVGAREQDSGDGLRFGHLFDGFRKNFGQLVLLGLFEMLVLIAVGAIFVLVLMFGLGMSMPTGASMPNISGIAIFVTIVLGIIVGAVYLMAIWFAPQLIVFNNFSAFQSLLASFKVQLDNWRAMLMYGLIGIVLLIGFSVLIGIGAGLGALIGSAGGLIAGGLALLIGAVLGLCVTPIIIGSIYASYRDCFYD